MLYLITFVTEQFGDFFYYYFIIIFVHIDLAGLAIASVSFLLFICFMALKSVL